MIETTSIDKRYLTALEILAFEEMEGGQNPEQLDKAREIVTQANLNNPREL
jgi:hypothetical protein